MVTLSGAFFDTHLCGVLDFKHDSDKIEFMFDLLNMSQNEFSKSKQTWASFYF